MKKHNFSEIDLILEMKITSDTDFLSMLKNYKKSADWIIPEATLMIKSLKVDAEKL